MSNITKNQVREAMKDVNRQHQKHVTKWVVTSFSVGVFLGSLAGVYLYVVLP